MVQNSPHSLTECSLGNMIKIDCFHSSSRLPEWYIWSNSFSRNSRPSYERWRYNSVEISFGPAAVLFVTFVECKIYLTVKSDFHCIWFFAGRGSLMSSLHVVVLEMCCVSLRFVEPWYSTGQWYQSFVSSAVADGLPSQGTPRGGEAGKKYISALKCSSNPKITLFVLIPVLWLVYLYPSLTLGIRSVVKLQKRWITKYLVDFIEKRISQLT